MQLDAARVNKFPYRIFRCQIFCRVADPHWFNADPDPAFFLIADPDSGSGSRVWWPKIEKNYSWKINFYFLDKKIAIYLSLGVLYGGLGISGLFLPSWIRIRNFNADPDPATQTNADPCGSGYGSGSATLIFCLISMNLWSAGEWGVWCQLHAGRRGTGSDQTGLWVSRLALQNGCVPAPSPSRTAGQFIQIFLVYVPDLSYLMTLSGLTNKCQTKYLSISLRKKQCGGSGMFIPDPGSEFFPSRISDPNCLHPGSRIRIKEFKYFKPKKGF